MGLSKIYEENGDLGKALEVLRRGIQVVPDHRDLYANGFYISARAGRREDASYFVEAWLAKHPGDKEFRQLMDNLDQILYEEFGIGDLPDTSGPAGQK